MIALITFLFIAIIGRLIYIEVAESEELQLLALEQWYRDVPLSAERGEIYDRNGILLAGSETNYTVYVRPTAVVNKTETAEILSAVFGLKYDAIYAKVNSRISETAIKKGVDKATMLTLVSSAVTGVYFSQNIKRVYPYGDFLCQILGFTNTDCAGQTGLENYYNSYLQGIDGYILTGTDLIGRELEDGMTYYVAGSQGSTAHLTIDYYIQSFAEQAVRAAQSEHGAKSASCIVMNSKTGEILAMAESPSFDLNNVPRDDVSALLSTAKSHLVSDVFEPGSTFKILTAAIGLDSGSVTRNYRCYCGGSLRVDGQKIKCWRTIGHGSQGFDDGVRNSCNCLFMNIALNTGTSTFYNYLENFGISSKTGIDLSGESTGLLIKEASVKNVDLARIGFGQAVAVTPIALVRSCAAVVNGGTLVTPHIVGSIESNGKTVFSASQTKATGVIKAATSASMREVLEKVVSDGSGRNAKVAGYRIGGKTGTAQKYLNGSIAAGKYVSTFLGFAPADDPEYICLMIVDEPVGQYYGSIVAAPYVGQIFAQMFNYLGIAPALSVNPPETFEMPDVTGLGLSEAVLALTARGLFYESVGEGAYISKQIPAAGAAITKDTVVYIELNQGG